jgi:hypothetical protein
VDRGGSFAIGFAFSGDMDAVTGKVGVHFKARGAVLC